MVNVFITTLDLITFACMMQEIYIFSRVTDKLSPPIFSICPAPRLKFFSMTETDEFWMREAICAALEAEKLDEIPIGACLIDKQGKLLAVAGNRTITNNDPTAHAEILVLREAAARIGNYRLVDTTIYTTLEPCAMCAGALVNARVQRLVFGATDERFGAVETVFRICDSEFLNHKIEIVSGILAEDCRKLMQDFFRQKRESQKSTRLIDNAT
jgi:tRNA(adenine34) deaminase